MNLSQLPALGAALEGGIFAGLTTDKQGLHYAIVLLPDKPEKLMPWKKAMAWADGLGAALPTRPVAALLFANLNDQFEAYWHWTCEELDGSFAWGQDFGDGYQGSHRKSYEGRARAVRLIQLST
jgi:hypothetical protein